MTDIVPAQLKPPPGPSLDETQGTVSSIPSLVEL